MLQAIERMPTGGKKWMEYIRRVHNDVYDWRFHFWLSSFTANQVNPWYEIGYGIQWSVVSDQSVWHLHNRLKLHLCPASNQCCCSEPIWIPCQTRCAGRLERNYLFIMPIDQQQLDRPDVQSHNSKSTWVYDKLVNQAWCLEIQSVSIQTRFWLYPNSRELWFHKQFERSQLSCDVIQSQNWRLLIASYYLLAEGHQLEPRDAAKLHRWQHSPVLHGVYKRLLDDNALSHQDWASEESLQLAVIGCSDNENCGV